MKRTVCYTKQFLKEKGYSLFYKGKKILDYVGQTDYQVKKLRTVLTKGEDVIEREEIEIRFDRNEFEKLERLFLALGLNVEIKWFRKRHSFKWADIDVMLDYTNGYGHIIELESKVLAALSQAASKFLTFESEPPCN